MTARFSVEISDSIGRITLDRGDDGNTIDQVFCDQLLDAVHTMETTEDVRCVLLSGVGRFFCVGGDINAFASASDNLPRFVREMTGSLHMAVARLAGLSKPIVTAVNGPAAGAGLGLALVGDVVIAAQSANFSVAYPGIGLSPDAGVSFLLPRLVGLRRAQEMIYLGRTFSADEAEACGLITRTSPDEQLYEETQKAASKIARMSIPALARAKRLLLQSTSRELEAQLEREAEAIAHCAVEPNAMEGVNAFLERRKPDFA